MFLALFAIGSGLLINKISLLSPFNFLFLISHGHCVPSIDHFLTSFTFSVKNRKEGKREKNKDKKENDKRTENVGLVQKDND